MGWCPVLIHELAPITCMGDFKAQQSHHVLHDLQSLVLYLYLPSRLGSSGLSSLPLTWAFVLQDQQLPRYLKRMQSSFLLFSDLSFNIEHPNQK